MPKLQKQVCMLTLVLVSGLSLLTTTTISQETNWLSSVPSEHRERLTGRLNEFVLAHKQKDWDRVFDLLGNQYLSAPTEPYGKTEFVQRKLYSKISRFTPKSVTKMENGWWMIWGCGSFPGNRMEAAVEVYFEKGDFFFSEIWSSPPCIDCKPRGCKH